MSELAHIAIDLGASGGRVIAGRVVAGKLELHTIHRFPNGPVRVQRSLLWDLVGLWQQILEGLTKAAAQVDGIASVGVDTWGVDYVLLDSRNEMIGQPFNHRDERTRGIYDRAFALVPKEQIFQTTGIQFMEINTIYQLLTHSGSPALANADGMLLIGDFFHWLLTGKRSLEITNASTTQMLDARTGQWSLPLIEKMGIPTKILMPVVEPGTNLGPVQASVRSQTGLGEVPVIVPATHDTASAVIAVPANDFAPAKPSWCFISSGTWSLMGCEIPEPLINDSVAKFNFTNERGIGGSTRLLKNIGGLWLFQQLRAALARRGQDVSWEQMVALAAQAPALSLLVNPDDPSFVAPDDMATAIQQFAARTGQTVVQDAGVLLRAALEGLALRYRVCLDSMQQMLDTRIDVIHVVGGGSMNALLCQMTADACNRTVIAGPMEATATGNVLVQMIGTGRLKDIHEARQLVRASVSPMVYHPQNPAAYDAVADRFQQLI